MKKEYYIPTSDAAKVIWLNTFNEILNEAAPGGLGITLGEYVGVTAGEMTQIDKDRKMFEFSIKNQDVFKNEGKERTSYKNRLSSGSSGKMMSAYPTSPVVTPPAPVPEGVFVRIPKIVARIKANSNYNDDIGKDLGIIGSEQTIDIANAKPVLKLSKVPSGWQIKFGLQSYFDGVHIYRKLPEQADFVFLATDTRSPYIDTDEIVSGTRYMAYFLDGDDEVGQESDSVTVQV
jgi:hypothetical protein